MKASKLSRYIVKNQNQGIFINNYKQMLQIVFNIIRQKRIMCNKKMTVVPVVAVVGTVVTVLTVLTVGVVAVVGDSVVNVVGVLVLSTTPDTQASS